MTRGRPRAFDADEALERALDVFWRKGFTDTSLTDLTEAMGINRPSLYAAYGDKQALFRKVVERYLEGPAAYSRQMLAEAPTARAAVEGLLLKSAGLLCDGGGRGRTGCLLVHGALGGGAEDAAIAAELAELRRLGEVALKERLDRALADGELPAGTDTAALAGFFTAVQQGMAVKARSGADADHLRAVVAQALRAWPGQ